MIVKFSRPTNVVAALAVVLGTTAALQAPAWAAEVMSTFKDWKTYRHGSGKDRMCFAVSAASKQEPGADQRGKAHAYVTTWPDAGIKAEISVLVGYPLQKGDEVVVRVGSASFKLFADGDRAFVADPNEELQLLGAMRRGADMQVEAKTAGGKQSNDVFSLSGVTAAIGAITSSCP